MKEEGITGDQDKDHLPGLPGELHEQSKTPRSSSSLVELDRDIVEKSRSPSRSTSHSLLSGSKGRPSMSRKGSFAGAEQSLANADRANVSMPSSLSSLSSKGTSSSSAKPQKVPDEAAEDQLKGHKDTMSSSSDSAPADADAVSKPEVQASRSRRSMSAVFGPDSVPVPQENSAILSNDSSRRLSLLSLKPAPPRPVGMKSPEPNSGNNNTTDTSKDTMDESIKDPSKPSGVDSGQIESPSSVTTVKDLPSEASSMPPPSSGQCGSSSCLSPSKKRVLMFIQCQHLKHPSHLPTLRPVLEMSKLAPKGGPGRW